MNNVQKIAECRRIAIERGYPKHLDAGFYMPIRTRLDGRSYIASNSDHALLFEPDWVLALFGNEPEDTGYIDPEKLEPVLLPSFKHIMLKMLLIRADKGDVIGFLYGEILARKNSLNNPGEA